MVISYRRFGTTYRSNPQGSRIELNSWTLRNGPIGCPETSVKITTARCLIIQKSAVLSYFAAESWNHARIALLRMLLVCISVCLKSVLRYNFFLFWMPIIRTLCIEANNDVRIRGYFSKPKGVREEKSMGNTALGRPHKLHYKVGRSTCPLCVTLWRCARTAPDIKHCTDVGTSCSVRLAAHHLHKKTRLTTETVWPWPSRDKFCPSQ